MPQTRVNSGAVAIARGKESSYGNGSPTLTHLMHTIAPQSARNFRLKNVSDEARGVEEMADQVELRDETALSFQHPLNDVSLAAVLGYGLGSDTMTIPSGATNARQHAFEPAAMATELPSTILQVNMKDRTSTGAGSGYTNAKHLGVVLSSFSMNGGVSSGEWTINPVWQTGGFGAQNGVSIAGKTSPVYSPFKFRNTFCFVGPSFTPGSLVLPNGSAPTGLELGGGASYQVDLSSRILGVGWNFNNNLDVEGGHTGSASTGALEMVRGQREQTLALDFKWDYNIGFLKSLRENEIDGSVVTSGNARAFSLGIMCVSNKALDSSGTVYYHAFSLFWPSVYLDGDVKFNNRGGRYAMSVPLRVGENGTQKSVYAYQWSLEASAWAA